MQIDYFPNLLVTLSLSKQSVQQLNRCLFTVISLFLFFLEAFGPYRLKTSSGCLGFEYVLSESLRDFRQQFGNMSGIEASVV